MIRKVLSGAIVLVSLFANAMSFQASAQKSNESMARAVVSDYLQQNKTHWNLSDRDLTDWTFSSQYTTALGSTYAYVHQQVNGVLIYNAVSSALIRNGKVVSFAKRLYPDALSKANSTKAILSPTVAIMKAAAHLGLELNSSPVLKNQEKNKNFYTYNDCGISKNPVTVELMYQPVKEQLVLCWNVTIRMKEESHWWNVRIDASNGNFLAKNDWTVHCDFGRPSSTRTLAPDLSIPSSSTPAVTRSMILPVYNVYAFPTEAPSFGPRTLLTDPSDAVASPYGWHDVDGIAGIEFTITRGNNVYAYDDTANLDAPGYSPDAGALLNFDYPINSLQPPSTYLDASNTNLFYVCNTIHDIMYHYGFDEVAGNFQENNYGHGGAETDYVVAECQDGGGTDNANFSTPNDGSSGWMQMYLWSGNAQSTLTVNSPGSIAGVYNAVPANFGPSISVPVTQDIVIANDGAGTTSDACQAITNIAAITGKIALIDRGTCTFVTKVQAAQDAGAVAAIIVNNSANAPFGMPDDGNGGSITIPSIMISQADGNLIKGILNAAGTVNATLDPPTSGAVAFDGSLDNGVITHEFGHGISNRLTGGPNNSSCLDNAEQGGEGWSDYFALMLTIKPGDVGTTGRGMGTYVEGQLPSGSGIRRYPYSTDMSIDPETYAYLAQSGEAHDVGEVWCTVLWEMSWALIDQYGFDPDWYHGTSGNNVAMQLVIEGCKLQPCNPGFLDARDAILAADDNLYGGIHKCLIWTAFAKRGMGANASQGDANTAGDETADYNLPPSCQIATVPPIANFDADVTSTCIGVVQFTDLSTNIAQGWLWDFGDHTTSVLQNPLHTYTAPGTYTVILHVTNTMGADSLTRTAYIQVTMPLAPVVSGDTIVCAGDSTTLTSVASGGNSLEWTDSLGNVLSSGSTYTTPALSGATTIYLRQQTTVAVQHVGPVNASFGGGGYHATSFEGQLLFTTFAPIRLLSVWVDASGQADREFHLYSSTGTLLQSKIVNLAGGQGRVNLNFDIPTAGDYRLGVVAGSNLYRNNAGATYPYTIGGLVSITTSNSTTNPSTFYYYCYDWAVEELPCSSPQVPIAISISTPPTSNFTFNANGLTLQFTDLSSGNPVAWHWDFGNGDTSNLQNPSETFANSNLYTITLTVRNADGCETTTNQVLLINGIETHVISGMNIYNEQNKVMVRFDHLPANGASIRITDILGRDLYTEQFRNGNLFSTTLRNFADGLIVVSVTQDGQTQNRKLFIHTEK